MTLEPLMDIVRRHGLIVTTHSSEPVGHLYPGKGCTRPDVLWRFIQNYPDATIVCAHLGGGLPFYSLMPEVRERLGNVYFDTAALPFLYATGVFDVVTGLVGHGRVLLGSDFPLMHAGRLLDEVERSGLPVEAKDAITGANGRRLLRI